MIVKEYKCIFYKLIPQPRDKNGDFVEPLREEIPSGEGTVIGYDNPYYIIIDKKGTTNFIRPRNVIIQL